MEFDGDEVEFDGDEVEFDGDEVEFDGDEEADIDSMIIVDKGFSDNNSENNEKENTGENTSRSAKSKKRKNSRGKRTTNDQIEKLFSYMESHADFSKGKRNDELNDDWEIFTEELNSIGPPTHTSMEWRTVWSTCKSNRKRKRIANPTGHLSVPFNEKPSTSKDVQNKENFHSEMLKTINVVTEQQTKMNSEGTLHAKTNIETDKRHTTQLSLPVVPLDDNGKPSTSNYVDNKENFHSEILKAMNVVVEQQIQTNNELKLFNNNLCELKVLNKNLSEVIELLKTKFVKN